MKNKVTTRKTWPTFHEIVRDLTNVDIDDKKKIFLEQDECMATTMVGKSVYLPEVMTRAFEHFATSRALYGKLTEDYQLPSIRTLSRITLKFANQDDMLFFEKLMLKIDICQRRSIVMIDEVYIKSALLYHGGIMFGKSANCPEKLTENIFAYMVKFLYSGPE